MAKLRGFKQLGATQEIVECRIAMEAGLPTLEQEYGEVACQIAEDMFPASFGIQQALFMAAHANGYDAQGGDRITARNLRGVLEAAMMPDVARAQLGGMASTISLPQVLGSVANKELRSGFDEETTELREMFVTRPIENFHPHTTHRLTDALEYEEIGPGGEIASGTLTESSYTRQAKTYAKMLGLTRQDVINDDLSAFDDIRRRLGIGGGQTMNRIAWTRWLADSAHFTAALGNYITGSTTNLGLDGVGLTAAVLAFRKLRSADGGRPTGKPAILLVPPELELNARRFHVSEYQNLGTSSVSTSPSANEFRGLYRPVVCDFLSDTAYVGSSTTAFYLMRNPATLSGMVISCLHGNLHPTVESTSADFNTLGILFRAVHDFGCDLSEPLAGVKSKGAA